MVINLGLNVLEFFRYTACTIGYSTRSSVVARVCRPHRLCPKASVRFLVAERKRLSRVTTVTLLALLSNATISAKMR